MDRLYLADNLKDIKEAFNFRAKLCTRWDNVKPRSIKEEIDEIDLKTDKWNAGEVNRIYRDMFDNYFNENIK